MNYTRVNIRVPEKLRDAYKEKAKSIGLTSSALMLIALTKYMQDEEGGCTHE